MLQTRAQMSPGGWESGAVALPKGTFAGLLHLMGTPVFLISNMKPIWTEFNPHISAEEAMA